VHLSAPRSRRPRRRRMLRASAAPEHADLPPVRRRDTGAQWQVLASGLVGATGMRLAFHEEAKPSALASSSSKVRISG
jgi:hypothetical protein